MQGKKQDQIMAMLGAQRGVEYRPREAKANNIFLIDKQLRVSPSKCTRLALYYILMDGKIYQAPNIKAIVTSRQKKCAHYMDRAFEALYPKLTSTGQHANALEKPIRHSKATEQRATNNFSRVESMLQVLHRNHRPEKREGEAAEARTSE